MRFNLNTAFVASLLIAASAAPAVAVPVVANNSFETVQTVPDPWSAFDTAYTQPFGNLETSGVPSWTFPSSTGGVPTGTYSGLVRAGALESAIPYPHGSNVAFVEVLGWFEQTISGFDAGQPYTVSFNATGRNDLNYGPQVLQVTLDGSPLLFGGINTVTPVNGVWNLYTSDAFTTSAGSHTLRFAGLTEADLTSFIDVVNVNAIPEPSSAALLAIGCVGLLARRRRIV